MIDLIHTDEQRNLIFKQLKSYLIEESQLLVDVIDPPDDEVLSACLSDLADEFIMRLQITPEPKISVSCENCQFSVHVSWPTVRVH
jgi:hypothetical protein